MRYTYLILLTFIIACTQSAPPNPAEMAPAQAPPKLPLPPPGMLEQLAPNLTSIDVMFYSGPSISMKDEPAIYTCLGHFTGHNPVMANHGCNPVGQIFFIGGIEKLMTAQLFFKENCRFVIFMENESAKYGVQLNEEGISFYSNMPI